jgi:hypothetical protein
MTVNVDMGEHMAVGDWFHRWKKQILEAQMLKCGSYVQSPYFQSRTLRKERVRGHSDPADLEEAASKHFVAATQYIAAVGNARAV